jgi:hypothetical protein
LERGFFLKNLTVAQKSANLITCKEIGGRPNHMDTAMANQKKIEIRTIQLFPASSTRTATGDIQGREGLELIAISKNLFNV